MTSMSLESQIDKLRKENQQLKDELLRAINNETKSSSCEFCYGLGIGSVTRHWLRSNLTEDWHAPITWEEIEARQKKAEAEFKNYAAST